NIQTGRMEAIPESAAVVDALMAACAVVPFYKPQSIPGDEQDNFYIDGINVANHPITETLQHLRSVPNIAKTFAEDYCEVLIYSVPLLPVESKELPGKVASYTSLVDVGLRALQLQRFQDALLESRL